jgi:hypothetical protein
MVRWILGFVSDAFIDLPVVRILGEVDDNTREMPSVLAGISRAHGS